MKALVPLFLILVAFLGLASAYNAATPYRQAGILKLQRGPDGLAARVPDVGAPDERQHANYIRHLMDGKGFPVLRPGSPDLGETYQSHQPPLYYVLSAGLAKVTGADPVKPESGFILRFLNTIIGCITITGIFFLGYWGTGKREIGFAAAAVAAFLPMFVALHGAVSNDPLLYCFCTWVLALCVRGATTNWSLRLSVGIGVLIGLALLTKTSALALLPLVGLALVLASRQELKEDRPAAMAWVVALALPLVIYAGWAVRNLNLYGDLFALKAFNEAFVGSPQASGFISELGPVAYFTQWVGWWTGRSLIGFFGYMDIPLFEATGMRSDQQGALFSFVLAIFAFATLFWFLRAKAIADEEPEVTSIAPLQILSLALAAITLVLFVRFNLQYFQGQARYLFLAIGPLCVWIGGGVAAVMRGRMAYAWVVISVLLGSLALLGLETLRSGFLSRLIGG